MASPHAAQLVFGTTGSAYHRWAQEHRLIARDLDLEGEPFFESCIRQAEDGAVPEGAALFVDDEVLKHGDIYGAMHSIVCLLLAGVDMIVGGRRFKARLPAHLQGPSLQGIAATIYEIQTGRSSAEVYAAVAEMAERRAS